MNIDLLVTEIRHELQTDTNRGLGQLAELASKYANDRELVYRAVLLKRSLASSRQAPSQEQIGQGVEILDALIADQRAAAASGGVTRRTIVEEARSRTMTIPVPNGVVLKCVGVHKTYRRGDFALKNISFEARFGEIIGIVGRNGNGKTTLFRLIVGELRPDGGILRFPVIQPEGTKVSWSRVIPQIAYVPQELPPWHGSLRSNLHYEAAVRGVQGVDNEREVSYIVERLGLTNELDKRWHELSGGYKLRFALALALVWKPKLLVLDEPLANLDFIAQQVVLKDLRHLTDSLRYPIAVLVSSQHVHMEMASKSRFQSGPDTRFAMAPTLVFADTPFLCAPSARSCPCPRDPA